MIKDSLKAMIKPALDYFLTYPLFKKFLKKQPRVKLFMIWEKSLDLSQAVS